MADKEYNTVGDLLKVLENNYDELTYCHIFNIVTDYDFEELEERVEALMYIKGKLHNNLDEVEFDDDGVSTREYLEVYGIED